MAFRSQNFISLCSGVGGLDLGFKLANPHARCRCYVEGEAYAVAVLIQRMEEACLDEAPIWDNIVNFDGRPWRGSISAIVGGYPCQPFSHAGKLLGAEDHRHLWPHVKRIIEEIRPQVCFFENVAHHLHLGFKQVHDDLEAMDFQIAAGVFSAEEFGAPHKRERLFILANSRSQESYWLPGGKWQNVPETRNLCGPLVKRGRSAFPPSPLDREAWEEVDRSFLPTLEPEVRGVADGLANRVDRLRACGNGVVPLVAAHAWRVLANSFLFGV